MKKERKAYTRSNHMWTREEFKTMIDLWDTSTSEQISKAIGVPRTTISSMATRMRNAGFKLPKKHANGYIDSLLKELLAEIKR